MHQCKPYPDRFACKVRAMGEFELVNEGRAAPLQPSILAPRAEVRLKARQPGTHELSGHFLDRFSSTSRRAHAKEYTPSRADNHGRRRPTCRHSPSISRTVVVVGHCTRITAHDFGGHRKTSITRGSFLAQPTPWVPHVPPDGG